MAEFFIDTGSGQVATRRQMIAAGLVTDTRPPPRPWLLIQGPRDASTMWYAVMRKQTRGVVIGTLCLRHGGHHASLLAQDWEEVPIEEIGGRLAA